jgi:hypothetical protein
VLSYLVRMRCQDPAFAFPPKRYAMPWFNRLEKEIRLGVFFRRTIASTAGRATAAWAVPSVRL